MLRKIVGAMGALALLAACAEQPEESGRAASTSDASIPVDLDVASYPIFGADAPGYQSDLSATAVYRPVPAPQPRPTLPAPTPQPPSVCPQPPAPQPAPKPTPQPVARTCPRGAVALPGLVGQRGDRYDELVCYVIAHPLMDCATACSVGGMRYHDATKTLIGDVWGNVYPPKSLATNEANAAAVVRALLKDNADFKAPTCGAKSESTGLVIEDRDPYQPHLRPKYNAHLVCGNAATHPYAAPFNRLQQRVCGCGL